MAYLVFKSDVAIKHPTSLIRAAKTESDVQLIHGGNTKTVSLVEISDEQYDLMYENVQIILNLIENKKDGSLPFE